MTSTRTRVLGAALAASTLLGGAIVGAQPASAQDGDSETREERRAERLQELRDRIDQAELDDRIDEDRAAELRQRLEERQANAEERRAERQVRFDELAGVLNTTADELMASLRDGMSLAEIATTNAVAVDDVINHLLERANERIDSSDRIDDERAAELRETLEERITARVNGERPERPEGEEGRHGRRFGGFGDRGNHGGAESGD